MSFFEALSYPFLYRALIVGVLVSLCAALLGVVLVLKHYSLIGHGLGEVGFASLTIAAALGLPAMATAIPMVVAAACLIIWLGQRNGATGDVAIGVMATSALALGVLVTSLAKGVNVDVSNYLFGSILAMSDADMLVSAVLSCLVILLYAAFYNRLFALAYDEINARATGMNAPVYQFLISFLTAATVVLGMRMMGTMLISSLIILPALTAKRLAGGFRAMVVLAACVSAVCFVVGLALSYALGLPTGASVVGVNLAALLVALAVSKFRR